jgi:hypothetical protein
MMIKISCRAVVDECCGGLECEVDRGYWSSGGLFWLGLDN